MEAARLRLENLDIISNGRIDALIRENKIDAKMATSLINDSTTAYHICKNLIVLQPHYG